jgi:hypothetical protein
MELITERTEDHIMRLLILVAAAALVVTGPAMADDSMQTGVKAARHQHNRNANASMNAAPASPATTDPGANDMRMKNLHDSGYNPAGDRDASGNMKQNGS